MKSFNTEQQPRGLRECTSHAKDVGGSTCTPLGNCEAEMCMSAAACHRVWAVDRSAVAMLPTDTAAQYATLTCVCMSIMVLVTSWSVAPCLLACMAAVHVRRQVPAERSCSADVPGQTHTTGHSGRQPWMHTSWEGSALNLCAASGPLPAAEAWHLRCHNGSRTASLPACELIVQQGAACCGHTTESHKSCMIYCKAQGRRTRMPLSGAHLQTGAGERGPASCLPR